MRHVRVDGYFVARQVVIDEEAVALRVFADSAYAGERVAQATCIGVEIVRKIEGQVGFQVHKRRWVVERFFAWIGRNRRFSRDVERLVRFVEAFLYAASAIILLRRLGRC